MDINVECLKENKDGSVDVLVHFDKEGLEFLVQEGLLAVIKQFIKQNENAQAGMKMRKKLDKKAKV